jgi:hypothetical protein
MIAMTNQGFCYWLQGYFEISLKPTLTKEQVLLIQNTLATIDEPLGYFTQWLTDLTTHFAALKYEPGVLQFFLPEIQTALNGVFYHVIDQSYEMDMTLEESKRIHDGITA